MSVFNTLKMLLSMHRSERRARRQIKSSIAVCVSKFESRVMLAAFESELLTFNGGSGGDPEVMIHPVGSTQSMASQPYFKQDVPMPNDSRRVAFWLLDETPGFPDAGRSVDSSNRVGQLARPRNENNRGNGRSYQPVATSSDRIMGFRTEFDHSVTGDVTVIAISANEGYQVRPYRLKPNPDDGDIKFEYLPTSEYSVAPNPPTGTNATHRERVTISIESRADGLDFDLSEGDFGGVGGPENWDDLTFSTVEPGYELRTDIDEYGNGEVDVRLTARPSVRGDKDLQSSGATGDFASIDTATFQHVAVILQASTAGPVRVNGSLDASVTFDATNWSDWQTVNVTSLGDGNTIPGQDGQWFITSKIEKTIPRFDTFFDEVPSAIPIIVNVADDDEFSVDPGDGIYVTEDGTVEDLFWIRIGQSPSADVTLSVQLEKTDIGQVEFSRDGGGHLQLSCRAHLWAGKPGVANTGARS